MDYKATLDGVRLVTRLLNFVTSNFIVDLLTLHPHVF
jgi:hypothetical protein